MVELLNIEVDLYEHECWLRGIEPGTETEVYSLEPTRLEEVEEDDILTDF